MCYAAKDCAMTELLKNLARLPKSASIPLSPSVTISLKTSLGCLVVCPKIFVLLSFHIVHSTSSTRPSKLLHTTTSTAYLCRSHQCIKLSSVSCVVRRCSCGKGSWWGRQGRRPLNRRRRREQVDGLVGLVDGLRGLNNKPFLFTLFLEVHLTVFKSTGL